jgi:hypothetical protein
MKITAVQSKNPKTLGRWAFCLLILGFSFSEPSSAATISYVGTQTSTGANGYAVANWSNAGVLKEFDVSGEKYGTSGYYQIRPMPWDPGAAELGEAAGSGNLLGTDASSSTTFSSAPSFLNSITGGVGTFVNYGGYGIFRGPDGSSLYRQGGLSVSVSNGAFDTPSGNNNGYFGVAFEFTVSSPTAFRIGITVDANGGGAYAPDYVGIYSGSTGTVFSSLLDRNAEPDMAIFEINALAGETFAASVWQRSGTQSVAPVSMITFDAIPEPSTALLALVGMGCLAIHSRRRR